LSILQYELSIAQLHASLVIIMQILSITASTAPELQQAIMKDSQKRDPLIAEPWTNDTFNSVDWQANQSSFSALSAG
jgi:hypothetical protein